MISDLESKRREAVELADADKVDKIQSQIDDLKTAPAADAPQRNDDTDVITSYNNANPWVSERTAKGALARESFAHYLQQGISAKEAITKMEDEIRREFPPVNERRTQPNTVENTRSTQSKRADRKLGWSDLTSDELRMYKAMPNAWEGDKGKEAFVQACADERKARGV